MIRIQSLGSGLLLALGLLIAESGNAQQPQPAPKAAKAAKPPAKAAAPAVPMVLEPRAIELLKASSARLAAARTIKFTATVAYESPSRFGPTLVFTTKSEVTLRRPDRLKVLTLADGPASEFYYDGKTIMAFAPAENLVAVTDAPPTIDAALKFAFDSAEIYYPFTDLILADPYAAIAEGMKLAFYIGQSNVVGGVTTDMVAFANDDVFIQIWIGAEDKLPRMVRGTYLADPLRLRHLLELSNWQLDPAVEPEAFASQRAGAATRIAFAQPSPKLPPGVKPPALRKASKPQPAKSQ